MKRALVIPVFFGFLLGCSGQPSEEKFIFERAQSAEKMLDVNFRKAERSINKRVYMERIADTMPAYYFRFIPAGCSSTNVKKGQSQSTLMKDNRKLQKWLKREKKNKCLDLYKIAAEKKLEYNNR